MTTALTAAVTTAITQSSRGCFLSYPHSHFRESPHLCRSSKHFRETWPIISMNLYCLDRLNSGPKWLSSWQFFFQKGRSCCEPSSCSRIPGHSFQLFQSAGSVVGLGFQACHSMKSSLGYIPFPLAAWWRFPRKIKRLTVKFSIGLGSALSCMWWWEGIWMWCWLYHGALRPRPSRPGTLWKWSGTLFMYIPTAEIPQMHHSVQMRWRKEQ